MKAFITYIFTVFFVPYAEAESLCSIDAEMCTPQTQAEQLKVIECEASKNANGCDEFYKENPKVKKRNCEAQVRCSTFMTVVDFYKACNIGSFNSAADSIRAIAAFVMADTEMPPALSEREKFFNNCTTPECKREILGPYAGLFTKEEIEGHPNDKNLDPKDPANAAYLQGLSSKTLYRQLLLKLRTKFREKTLTEPFIEPWSDKPVNFSKMKTVGETITSVFEKAGLVNSACYSPEVLAEMRCYAMTAILDPFAKARVIADLQKIAGVNPKLVQEAGAAKKTTAQEARIAENAADFAEAPKAERAEIAKPKPVEKPVINPKENISRYPAVAQKIEEANDFVRNKTYPAQVKDIDDVKWDDYAVPYIEKSASAALKTKLADMDPEIKSSMHGIVNKMNDPEKFVSYMEKLQSDTILEIEKKGIKKELDGLQAGEVSENAVLRVLVQRAKENGQGNLSMIVKSKEGKTTQSRKPKSNEAFREAIAQGSFFDKPFNGEPHGKSTHLLQQDYVSDVVKQSTNGNPQKFWKYLGTKKGINYWVALFDSSMPNSFSQPEFTTRVVRKYMKFK